MYDSIWGPPEAAGIRPYRAAVGMGVSNNSGLGARYPQGARNPADHVTSSQRKSTKKAGSSQL